MKQSQSAVNRNLVAGKVQSFIGYNVAGFCGLSAIIGSATSGLKKPIDVTMVSILTGLALLGVLQIVRGKRRKKLILLFREYAARLAADPDRSIIKLAAATGADQAYVIKNLQSMIKKGFFVSAFIDHGKNRIVFSQESSLYEKKNAEVQAEYSSVTCPGCGAKQKVQKGTMGECEFCGSYLAQ